MLLRLDKTCTKFLGQIADRSVWGRQLALFGSTYLLPLFFLMAAAEYLWRTRTTDSWLLYLVCLGVSVLVPYAVTLTVSFLIRRKRPYETMPDAWHLSLRIYTPSFPSGHATLAFATATFLAWYWHPALFILVFWYLIAAGVAWSRVVVSVHYVSDVFVGALIGFLGGTFMSLLGSMLWTAQSV